MPNVAIVQGDHYNKHLLSWHTHMPHTNISNTYSKHGHMAGILRTYKFFCNFLFGAVCNQGPVLIAPLNCERGGVSLISDRFVKFKVMTVIAPEYIPLDAVDWLRTAKSTRCVNVLIIELSTGCLNVLKAANPLLLLEWRRFMSRFNSLMPPERKSERFIEGRCYPMYTCIIVYRFGTRLVSPIQLNILNHLNVSRSLSSFSPDSEAMGFLLQITMSCPCARSRQVAGAGAGCRCWCCELAVHAGVVSWLRAWWRQVAGAGRRVPVLVLVPGAGAFAVSWLCTWWRQVAGAGAGRRCWWCSLCAWCRVGAGAGCWRWLCA